VLESTGVQGGGVPRKEKEKTEEAVVPAPARNSGQESDLRKKGLTRRRTKHYGRGFFLGNLYSLIRKGKDRLRKETIILRKGPLRTRPKLLPLGGGVPFHPAKEGRVSER